MHKDRPYKDNRRKIGLFWVKIVSYIVNYNPEMAGIVRPLSSKRDVQGSNPTEDIPFFGIL